ncbi:MAG: hypothetical protein KDA86_28475 [Planctomycetaceae bacterium]|nr:hypothetical protein [Planctomycetaceae bacterium]
MKYAVGKWLHNNPDEPVLIISELDDEQWETRKVEIWANGKKGFADALHEVGGTALGLEPWPDFNEINTDPQFKVELISKDDFERHWDERLSLEGA